MMTNEWVDAVEMKRQCQEAANVRYAGMTHDQRRQAEAEFMATSDSPMARLWRDLVAQQAVVAPNR